MSQTIRSAQLLRGLYLEYATLSWNVIGAGLVLVAAYLAGSVALAGFGIDSLIEIFASVVVIWQLRGADHARERRALRLIGGAFMLLAAYVLVQSHICRANASSAFMGWNVLASSDCSRDVTAGVEQASHWHTAW